MLIARQAYKVNAIFHSTYIEKDHYTNMYREGTSWIEIDDAQNTKKQWPEGAEEIYIIFTKNCY